MIYPALVIFPFVMLVCFLVALLYAIHTCNRNRYLKLLNKRMAALLNQYMQEEYARLKKEPSLTYIEAYRQANKCGSIAQK